MTKIENKNPGVIQAHLADVGFVYGQMHTRMQGIHQLISQGIFLFTVIVPLLLLYRDTLIDKQMFFIFLLIPVPFYFLILIQIREDILMFSHDKYFQILRKK